MSTLDTLLSIAAGLKQPGIGSAIRQLGMEELLNGQFPGYSVDEDGHVIGLSLVNIDLRKSRLSLEKLTQLRALRLAYVNLVEVPQFVRALPGLELLHLAGNRLVSLPTWLAELTKLRVLGLNTNPLTELPDALLQLPSLTRLGLSRTSLKPAQLDRLRAMTSLSELFLSDIGLTEIPSGILELTELRRLSLGRNPMRTVPAAIAQLENIEQLDLSGTIITTLPAEVYSLPQIRELSVARSELQLLAPELRGTSTLRRLYCAETRLSALPLAIAELPELTHLHLAETAVGGDLHVAFGNRQLQYLNVSGVKANELPSEVSHLTALATLNAERMGLVAVPAGLFALPALRHLDLIGNAIASLPPEAATSAIDIVTHAGQARRRAIVSGNPLVSPPLEILRRGPDAVRTYLAEITAKARPIEEVKLSIIGDGGAGKTSLARQLLGRGFDEAEPQTHGINIDSWEAHTEKRTIHTRLWDFGGQEIMHATHQFFLSKRSAYLLVVDGRKDEKTEYWLKHIEAFGGGSPVIIVINKVDQNPGFDVNRRFLQEKYPNIRGFVRLSCRTPSGIEELKEALAQTVASVQHTKTLWPDGWHQVKHALETLRQDHLTLEEYAALCARLGVPDAKAQAVLLDFLHDLGVVLHFRELSLRDTNVINPRWLTSAVYRLVNAEQVARDGGLLNVETIPQILDGRTHPPKTHQFVVEMMKKFELCYQIDSRRILIPALLPIEEPALTAMVAPLRFLIDYDFLPRSIMPRFMVRMQRDIVDDLRWRTGVVMSNKDFDAQTVVRVDEADRRLTIQVGGAQRREYLAVMLHALREINSSFERIGAVEKIPMRDNPAVTVSYQHLLRLEKMGQTTYIPDGASVEYSVDEVLGGIIPPRTAEEEMLQLLRRIADQRDTEESLTAKANKAVLLQPNFFGLGVNVNEIVAQFLSKRKRK